jgi:hypothetical protein
MDKSVHEIITKKCVSCKEFLPYTSFSNNRKRKDGKSNECRSCANKRIKKWTEENYDRKVEYMKKWNKQDKSKEMRRLSRIKWNRENVEKMTECRRNWVLNNPRKDRNRRLVYSTGITLEKYEEMSKNQNGVCAICGHISEDGRQLCVDHCHKTKQIRGLLCTKCNTGLGLFRDDIELFEKAINYLKDND